jgi:hypothetical protein
MSIVGRIMKRALAASISIVVALLATTAGAQGADRIQV